MHFPSTTALLLGALTVAPAVVGHSWIEQLRNIGSDGSYVGEYGYPRGFKDKAAPGYNGETDMNYLLPPLEQQPPFINATNLLCHPNQRKPVQSDKFPRLSSAPGTWLALRYAENGHVSNPSNLNGHVPGELDLGRRKNGGSVFVFGTKEPKEDEKIADVLRWTKDGQGGDKRGILVAVNDYDDGRCYEINPVTQDRQEQFPNRAAGAAKDATGFPLYCETNVQLPKDAEVGKPYTLYWVWQWPVEAGSGPNRDPIFPKGKDQYYTTCMDVDIAGEIQQQVASMEFAIGQQDGQEKAVQNFRNRPKALITDPIAGNVGPLFRANETTSTAVPTTMPPQTTFATSFTAPYMNTTITSATPVITAPADSTTTAAGDGNVVRITVTERITVTATPSAAAPTTTQGAQKKRALSGAKFRF